MFEVSGEAYKVLEDILKEAGKNIDTRASPKKILTNIGKILKKLDFKYKPEALLSQSLITKNGDCHQYSLLYYSISEELGLPLNIVNAPNHVFVRWDNNFNWETTLLPKTKNSEAYKKWLNISEKSIASGVYLKNLTREEAKAYVFLNRGISQKDLEAALLDYEKAIELNSNFVIAYFNHGIKKEIKRDLEGALTDYNKAIDLDPNYKSAYNNRGLVKLKQKNLESALKDFNQAIILDPKYAKAYINRGIVRYQSEDFQKAMEDLNKAIELDPNHESSYYHRGQVKLKINDKEGAEKDLEIYRKIKKRLKNENSSA